jgi:hypothetical protein
MPGIMGDYMSTDVRHYIPLTSAYLCQDCASIGNNSMHCPACASDVLMPLEGVLNRKNASKSRNRTHSEFPKWRSQIQIAA